MLRIHNSARSQLAEGLTRKAAQSIGFDLDVFSAGTEATSVKANAVTVMAELGINLSAAFSKTLFGLPDPWNFDYVVTVCDSAAEACPSYPARTTMWHYPFTDPSGGSLERWRTVRGQLAFWFTAFVQALSDGQPIPDSYGQSPAVPVA